MSASAALRTSSPRPVGNPQRTGGRHGRVYLHPSSLPDRCATAVTAAVSRAARRFRLDAADAEDLRSELWLKLAGGHGRLLHQFRGEGSLVAFLTAVACNLVRDQHDRSWGKWRPCSAARHAGRFGIKLDQMIRRDGFTVAEAKEWFRTVYPDMDHSWIPDLAAQLPPRVSGRVADWKLAEAAYERSVPALDLLEQQECAETRADAFDALADALAGLPAADRKLLVDRYVHGQTVARIAEHTGQEAKPLYRHFEHVLRLLRGRLETRGVTAQSVGCWLGEAVDAGRV